MPSAPIAPTRSARRAGRAGSARRAAVTLAAALLLLLAAPVAAQDATPPAGEAVDPAECDVAPITVEEVLAIRAAADGAPVVDTDAALPPIDAALLTPADPATAEAVAAAARQVIACVNADDGGRLLALLSDDLIRAFLADGDGATEDLRAEIESQLAATPEPAPVEEQTRLVSVAVSVLPDGRVVAAVVVDPVENVNSGYWEFVEDDGRWRLAAFIPALVPGAATPSATADPGQGTPDDPAPFGASAAVGQWSVWVAAVDADAAAALAEDGGHPTPADGERYVLITLGTAFLGAGESDPYLDLTWGAVGPSGTVYDEGDDDCSGERLPGDLIAVDEVVAGDSAQGTICFAVAATDAEDLVLTIALVDGDEEPVYFSLR